MTRFHLRANQPEQDEALFTLSALARLFDIRTRAIRYHEEKGLLAPQRIKGNQRIDSTRERGRLKLILRGKRFGNSLDEIAAMIGLNDVDMHEVAQIEASLVFADQKLKELHARIEDLQMFAKDLLAVKPCLIRRLSALQGRAENPHRSDR